MNRTRSPRRLGALWLSTAPALTALLLSPDTGACPTCAAGIRAQVHAAIFDGSFAANLAMTALPFGVLAAILAAILVGPPWRTDKADKEE